MNHFSGKEKRHSSRRLVKHIRSAISFDFLIYIIIGLEATFGRINKRSYLNNYRYAALKYLTKARSFAVQKNLLLRTHAWRGTTKKRLTF